MVSALIPSGRIREEVLGSASVECICWRHPVRSNELSADHRQEHNLSKFRALACEGLGNDIMSRYPGYLFHVTWIGRWFSNAEIKT